jgi:hypothetical protein
LIIAGVDGSSLASTPSLRPDITTFGRFVIADGVGGPRWLIRPWAEIGRDTAVFDELVEGFVSDEDGGDSSS